MERRSRAAVHQSIEAPTDKPTSEAPNGVSTETAFLSRSASSGHTSRNRLLVLVILSRTSTSDWTATTCAGSESSATILARRTSLSSIVAAGPTRPLLSAASAVDTSRSRSVLVIVSGGSAIQCPFNFTSEHPQRRDPKPTSTSVVVHWLCPERRDLCDILHQPERT
jgi:hypothetical protein